MQTRPRTPILKLLQDDDLNVSTLSESDPASISELARQIGQMRPGPRPTYSPSKLHYVVITHPPECSHWVNDDNRVQQLRKILALFPSYYVVLEHGKSNSHHHYNIIVQTKTKQRDGGNTRNKFKEYFSTLDHWNKENLKVTVCYGDMAIIWQYIHKEPNYHVFASKVSPDALSQFPVTPNDQAMWHARALDAIATTADALDTVKTPKLITYRKGNQYQQFHQLMIERKVQIDCYEEFVAFAVDLAAEGINFPDMLSKPKHAYCIICSQYSEDARRQMRNILINNGQLN